MLNTSQEQKHRSYIDDLLQSGEFQRVDRDTAEREGKEAIDQLSQFYIEHGVQPEVAREYAAKMPGEELAGLRMNFMTAGKIHPDLSEVTQAFERLVNKGYDPNAVAILMSDGNFRTLHTGQFLVLMNTNAGDISTRIAGMYQERLSQGDQPIVAATLVVDQMAQSYKSR